MDFNKALEPLPEQDRSAAGEWYSALISRRDEAVRPGSLKISGETPIPQEYQCAVNWYNVHIESHLTDSDQSTFADFIAKGWHNTPDEPLKSIHWRTLMEICCEQEYQDALAAHGEQIDNAALDDEIGEHLVSFISSDSLNQRVDSDGDSFVCWPPDPSVPLDAARIVRDFFENPSPVVWCSSWKRIEGDLSKTCRFDETGQKLGLSHASTTVDPPGERFYGIRFATALLKKECRFPTVADARMFHVFEPSTDRIGRTLDLRNGGTGLPEVVLKRTHLSEKHQQNPSVADVAVCHAPGADAQQHTWVLSRPIGCEPQHMRTRLARVRNAL